MSDINILLSMGLIMEEQCCASEKPMNFLGSAAIQSMLGLVCETHASITSTYLILEATLRAQEKENKKTSIYSKDQINSSTNPLIPTSENAMFIMVRWEWGR